MIPKNPDNFVPFELPEVLWAQVSQSQKEFLIENGILDQ